MSPSHAHDSKLIVWSLVGRIVSADDFCFDGDVDDNSDEDGGETPLAGSKVMSITTSFVAIPVLCFNVTMPLSVKELIFDITDGIVVSTTDKSAESVVPLVAGLFSKMIAYN